MNDECNLGSNTNDLSTSAPAAMLTILVLLTGFNCVHAQSTQVTPAAAAAQARPLRAYWKLDEPAGASSFADASGNGNTGTCSSSGCPTMGVAGKVGTAASFNGTSKQITIPDSSSLRLNQFTIALWVYPTRVKTDYQPLVVKEDSAGNKRNYGLFILPNTQQVRYAAWAGDCATKFAASSVGKLTLNRWSQVTFTYDGITERLYLNGVLDSSNAASSKSLCQAAVPVKLGSETSAFLPFSGLLDDVHIYGTALNAKDVGNLYAVSSATPPSPHALPLSKELPARPDGKKFRFDVTLDTKDIALFASPDTADLSRRSRPRDGRASSYEYPESPLHTLE